MRDLLERHQNQHLQKTGGAAQQCRKRQQITSTLAVASRRRPWKDDRVPLAAMGKSKKSCFASIKWRTPALITPERVRVILDRGAKKIAAITFLRRLGESGASSQASDCPRCRFGTLSMRVATDMLKSRRIRGPAPNNDCSRENHDADSAHHSLPRFGIV